MKRLFKCVASVLLPICLTVFGLVGYTGDTYPVTYRAAQAGRVNLPAGWLSAVATPVRSPKAYPVATDADGQVYTATLRLWGLFPVKDVTVQVEPEPLVAIGGTPFGIKLYTDGVLVVGLTAVDHTGAGSPAKQAGVRVGDLLLSVNGQEVSTNEEVAALVSDSGGRMLTLKLRRDGVEFEAQVSPVLSNAEGVYKAGMWVRDSSAGIGTMTFYDPESHVFAGLGHAVCDVDTGEPLPISGGELVPASIFGVTRGVVGAAGELRGCFDKGTLGPLESNVETGVFGRLEVTPKDTVLLPLCRKQQVVTGAAKVRTTLSGQAPDWYDLEIVQVRYNDGSPTRNMVIRITDPRLLEATGGIVQGMSGSPIVQNGKLVAAVTHVFVNDPTQGFAVFAENMYDTSKTLCERADAAA